MIRNRRNPSWDRNRRNPSWDVRQDGRWFRIFNNGQDTGKYFSDRATAESRAAQTHGGTAPTPAPKPAAQAKEVPPPAPKPAPPPPAPKPAAQAKEVPPHTPISQYVHLQKEGRGFKTKTKTKPKPREPQREYLPVELPKPREPQREYLPVELITHGHDKTDNIFVGYGAKYGAKVSERVAPGGRDYLSSEFIFQGRWKMLPHTAGPFERYWEGYTFRPVADPEDAVLWLIEAIGNSQREFDAWVQREKAKQEKGWEEMRVREKAQFFGTANVRLEALEGATVWVEVVTWHGGAILAFEKNEGWTLGPNEISPEDMYIEDAWLIEFVELKVGRSWAQVLAWARGKEDAQRERDRREEEQYRQRRQEREGLDARKTFGIPEDKIRKYEGFCRLATDRATTEAEKSNARRYMLKFEAEHPGIERFRPAVKNPRRGSPLKRAGGRGLRP